MNKPPVSRIVPKGAVIVRAKKSSAIVYCYGVLGVFYAAGFSGRRTKADFRFSFRSAKARANWVDGYLSRVAEAEAVRADREAQRKAALAKPCELQVGDVLTGSWGYDQTNVEWFQVVEQRGRRVAIREIASEVEFTGAMQGRCVPLPGQFKGREPLARVVQAGGRVKLNSSCSLSKAERLVVAGVAAGYKPASWTAYA